MACLQPSFLIASRKSLRDCKKASNPAHACIIGSVETNRFHCGSQMLRPFASVFYAVVYHGWDFDSFKFSAG
jgi:hypothetical protein